MGKFGEWVSSKVFRHVHGNNLVYNICWEDPRIDRTALELKPSDDVLVITSAGCNALDYILAGCNHVYAVDMNYRQNAVLDLKKASAKLLDYEDFFKIWGNGSHPQFRKLYRETLRAELPDMSRKFWDKKACYFCNAKRPYYFRGTAGYFARWINTYVDHVGHIRKEVTQLFNAKTLEEQREIYLGQLKKKFWTRVMRFCLNRDTTLSMLGVPRAQREQVEKHYNGRIVDFMQDCLETVLCELPIQDNYFWRVYTTGHYTPECCPEYVKEENFQRLKDGLADQVTTYTDSVEGFLRKNEVPISRFILLDHMDWLASNLFPALVSEWDAIWQRATDDARILWRSGGMETDFLERVPLTLDGKEEPLLNHLKQYPEWSEDLHKKDRVHTYGSFYIADVIK